VQLWDDFELVEEEDLPVPSDEELEEIRGQTNCDICGERFTLDPHEEIGEFALPFDPDYPTGSVVAHAQCGLDAGYEIA
jgi:hypothetical protein